MLSCVHLVGFDPERSNAGDEAGHAGSFGLFAFGPLIATSPPDPFALTLGMSVTGCC